MKITKAIKNYIISQEMLAMGNIYSYILQEKTEKLLFSLPLADISQAEEVIDLNSNTIPFDKDDFDSVFRMHYWIKGIIDEAEVDFAHFVLFKEKSTCGRRGMYQYILILGGENQPCRLKLLTEKPLAVSIENFLKGSSGVFIDRDTFKERYEDYQKKQLSEFEKEYYDVKEVITKTPQTLFNQVSFFIIKRRSLFPKFEMVPQTISDKIPLLETKLQLAKYMNEFSYQSIELNEQNIRSGDEMLSNLAELIKNNLLSPPVLFFQEFKEQIVSKSRYFYVYMMQKRNEVVMGDRVGTLKINSVDDSCILYKKEILVRHSEKDTLEKLQECWKAAKGVVTLYLLPGADKPLAATYKLSISRAEEDVGAKLTV